MSTDENDVAYDMYMSDLYEEHREEAVAEFRRERLQSFFREHRGIAHPALAALVESRRIEPTSPRAAVVLAAVAIECGIKTAILKPVVFGLVHSEAIAEHISELALRHTRLDFFEKLVFPLLLEFGGIDINRFCRPGSGTPLWTEIAQVQKKRDLIMHRAELATTREAWDAIAVADAVLTQVFPTVVKSLDLRVVDGSVA